jgi:hypothetical protein
MKVKKVGNIEEQSQVDIPQQPPKLEKVEVDSPIKSEKTNKTKYYIIGGVFLVIIAALLYYFLIYQNSSDIKTTDKTIQDELKSKELELKERELKLKEQEQQKNNTTPTQPVYNLNTPEGVVVKFIESLGKRDFSAAFALMTEKRRGNYNTFVSTKGYGGITSTKVLSCSKTGQINEKYEVMVTYESIDPMNRSGKFNQFFYLIPFNDSYLISEIKNINIQWYDEGD